MSNIYEPREDSYLILEEVRRLANGNVLDMGTGSGILALASALKADHVIGADIDPKAVEFAKDTAKASGLTNLQFVKSDLFSYFQAHPQRFDIIIFNPPYLPEDLREPKDSRLTTTGGKKGYELLDRFFSQASKYLMPYGKILIIFSSLTGKDKVHDIIENYAFNFQKISEEDMFAETLFVYLAEKSDLLRALESNKITDIKKIAKGHRGLIFKGRLDKKTVVAKQQRQDIAAIGRIENEARWLKVLNRKNIGPRFIYSDNNYFVYEYVDGIFIPEFLENASKANIKKVLTDVFKQCFALDQMSVNKEEMHNPYKHIIIKNNKPVQIDAGKSKISGISKTPKVVLIDFERTHVTEKPKNVTQFCQYVTSAKNKKILKEKALNIDKKKVMSAAKRYKKRMTEDNLKEIIKLIK